MSWIRGQKALACWQDQGNQPSGAQKSKSMRRTSFNWTRCL